MCTLFCINSENFNFDMESNQIFEQLYQYFIHLINVFVFFVIISISPLLGYVLVMMSNQTPLLHFAEYLYC